MLWAEDGALKDPAGPDTLRIRIWQEDDAGSEAAVYHNGVGQPLAGGSIVIHEPRAKGGKS